MKKILLFLCFLIMSLTVSAQEEKHLDFKGIPIDGDITSFVKELQKKGFTKISDFDGGVLMNGVFVGKEAEVYISSSAKTNTVWKVSVFIDKDASWSRLKSSYFEYVDLYKQKYGEPDSHYEFFSDPYYEGDGYELQALRLEKCHYVSFFETSLGSLAVNIFKTGQIRFIYEDKVNINKMIEEKNQEILDDI